MSQRRSLKSKLKLFTENENTTYQTLHDTSKTALKGTFIELFVNI
jgi:hypothetical protein